MNVDMTKNLGYAFCNSDGGPAIVVQKRGSGAESFSGGLETEYRLRIGRETWGDNNTRGDNKVDIKVDNKVDNNARGDNKVDNNVGDDTVNDTVTRPENGAEPDQKTVRSPTRIRPEVDNNLGDTVNGTASGPLSGLKSGPLSGPLNGPLKDKVMNLIAEIPGVNRKDLICRTGVSERTMTRNLSELERSGKIERRGSKKTGGYFLAEGSGEKRVEGQSK